MTAEIKMRIDERRKYLLRRRLYCVRVHRTNRSRLADEMEAAMELQVRAYLGFDRLDSLAHVQLVSQLDQDCAARCLRRRASILA